MDAPLWDGCVGIVLGFDTKENEGSLDDEEKDRAVALMRSDQVARRTTRGALRSKVERCKSAAIGIS
jgi:hypothetical protein